MTKMTMMVLAAALGWPAAAMAEVKSVEPQGFMIVNRVATGASPAQAYAALIEPRRWWNPAHSFSQDAANFSLDAKAGGCFCEALPKNGGSIEHMRVVNVVPGAMLRLRGALGPLQGEGVDGALTWKIEAADGGGSTITQTYVVGGYLAAGTAKIAPIVDMVIGEQLARLKALLDKPR